MHGSKTRHLTLTGRSGATNSKANARSLGYQIFVSLWPNMMSWVMGRLSVAVLSLSINWNIVAWDALELHVGRGLHVLLDLALDMTWPDLLGIRIYLCLYL